MNFHEIENTAPIYLHDVTLCVQTKLKPVSRSRWFGTSGNPWDLCRASLQSTSTWSIIATKSGWVFRVNGFFLALIWSCQKHKRCSQFLKQCGKSHSLCLTSCGSFLSVLLSPAAL